MPGPSANALQAIPLAGSAPRSGSIGKPKILVMVPVYNHAATLPEVVQGILALHPHVLVVDDGSTDLPVIVSSGPEDALRPLAGNQDTAVKYAINEQLPEDHPLYGLPVLMLRHDKNRGKGAAIRTGATMARQLGMSHIVTIDADAQHDPSDLPAFFQAVEEDPTAIFVGKRNFDTPNVPRSSTFGRAFSNFWYKVQTENTIGDSQSGFRSYPLALLETVKCTDNRYSFETEILVRSSWAGFPVRDIPIRVHYQPGRERVSHFHPLLDNIRISILNTRLTIRSIMPVPQKKYAHDAEGVITALHPLRSLRTLLCRNETPKKVALSGALGMALGTLPLIGIHSIAIILAAVALKLNKIVGLAVSQLCMPPFVPALCIEAGYYLRNGRFLTEISLQTLGYEALDRVVDWILGSLVLAPLLALIMGLLLFVLSLAVRFGLQNARHEAGQSASAGTDNAAQPCATGSPDEIKPGEAGQGESHG